MMMAGDRIRQRHPWSWRLLLVVVVLACLLAPALSAPSETDDKPSFSPLAESPSEVPVPAEDTEGEGEGVSGQDEAGGEGVSGREEDEAVSSNSIVAAINHSPSTSDMLGYYDYLVNFLNFFNLMDSQHLLNENLMPKSLLNWIRYVLPPSLSLVLQR